MDLQVHVRDVSDEAANIMMDYCIDNNIVTESVFYVSDSISDVGSMTFTFSKTEDVLLFKLKFNCL
jgi:predicted HAD superfamily phosphohydrolase